MPRTTGSRTAGKRSLSVPSASDDVTCATVAAFAAATTPNVSCSGSEGALLSPTYRWSQLTKVHPRAACQPAWPPPEPSGMSNVK
jgi:hypothetical protein